MKILIACEFSGTVREAFRARGHRAYSCDLLPDENASRHHIQGDVIDVLHNDPHWDMMIAHPPCTHLANSGARWFSGKVAEQAAAIAFVETLWGFPIPKVCIENPVGVLSTRSRLRKPTQIVQPYHFGDAATKTTCLWLCGLPKLVPTNIVSPGLRHTTKSGRSLPLWYNLPPSPDRWKLRSRTFPGFAAAMAAQWGGEE